MSNNNLEDCKRCHSSKFESLEATFDYNKIGETYGLDLKLECFCGNVLCFRIQETKIHINENTTK